MSFVTNNSTISGYLEQLYGGINTISGQSIIDGILAVTTDGPSTRLIIDTHNSTNTLGSSLRGRRSGGTPINPSGVLSGWNLLQIAGDGHDTTGYFAPGATISLTAAEDWQTDAHGTNITFRTTTTGTLNRALRMIIDHNGNVGIGQANPNYLLDVNGVGNFVSGVYWNGVPVLTGGAATIINLESTGQQAWGAANSNAIALSGALTQTGVTLIARDTAISGAIGTKLSSTGAILDGRIGSLSGLTTSLSGSLHQRDIDISGALASQIAGGAGTPIRVTGSSILSAADFTGIGGIVVLFSGGKVFVNGGGGAADDSSISGVLTQTGIQLQSLITNSGASLYSLITDASGQANINFATVLTLAATGQQAWMAANANSVNLSGDLTATGASLFARDGLISGALDTKVAATGLSLYGLVMGLSGQAVGTYATIATTNLISGNLIQTGAQLRTLVAGVSGGLEARISATGNSAVAHANGIGAILSGNLTQTGLAIGLVSGALDTKIAATGNQAWSAANGNGINLSGALAQTGVQLVSSLAVLSGNLTATGAALSAVKVSGSSVIPVANFSGIGSISVVYLDNQVLISGTAGSAGSNADGVNLSGNLTQTGVQLGAQISSLSGFTTNMSGALQTLIAGGGSVVKVSGSAVIATADFTGIGGTLVFQSGSQIFISGATPPAGGGLTQSQVLTRTLGA